MPPLPSPGPILRTALIWSIGEYVGALTRFFTLYTGSAPTVGDLDGWATNVATSVSDYLKALFPASTVLSQVNAVDLSSDTGAEIELPSDIGGTRDGLILPEDNCVVTSYEINRRYRGGHPRGYWPFGVQEDLTDSRLWSDEFVADVGEGIDNFFSALTSGEWSGGGGVYGVNVSYKHGFTVVISPMTGRARNVPTTRADPVVDTIEDQIVRDYIGSQRRRLGRVS